MKITNAQINFLKSEFVCERLTSRSCNRLLIQNVRNNVNPSLVQILQSSEAWIKDFLHETAYYLIKDKDDNIAFFFSLQTGCVFDHKDSLEERAENIRILKIAIESREKLDKGSDDINAIFFLKKTNLYSLTKKQLEYLLEQNQKKLQHKKIDVDLENNKDIYRVINTYSSIELHIFCKNDLYVPTWKKKIKDLEFPDDKRMGEIFFWFFVVDILKEIQIQTGCSYLYLFAADNPRKKNTGVYEEDRSLINYYEDKLKISRNKQFATNKPSFDYACIFMVRKINELYGFQESFFDNFNLSLEELAQAV